MSTNTRNSRPYEIVATRDPGGNLVAGHPKQVPLGLQRDWGFTLDALGPCVCLACLSASGSFTWRSTPLFRLLREVREHEPRPGKEPMPEVLILWLIGTIVKRFRGKPGLSAYPYDRGSYESGSHAASQEDHALAALEAAARLGTPPFQLQRIVADLVGGPAQ